MEAGILSYVLNSFSGSGGYVIGALVIGGQLWYHMRLLKLQKDQHSSSEADSALQHLSNEVRFLAEENRKLRQEILDLRETYVELHERYLAVLQDLSQIK